MTPRQWLPLIGITICVFMFNMSEFMPIGLLTDISSDLGISESKAGTIISIYAWAVAIFSLPIMLALKKMQFRPMLLMTVILFAIFQLVSGVATSYETLIVARLGVAIAHCIFWSIAIPLAVSVVPPDYRNLAVSCVAAGTSVAMIVGLPLGRVIGLALGWRMTFIVIAAVALLVLLLLVFVFPSVDNPGTFTLKKLPSLLSNRVLIGIYVVLAIFVTGYYTGYSYIEPFLLQTGNLSEIMVTVALTVFGLAGIAGSAVFTKFYDRVRYSFMVLALIGVSICLFLLNPSTVHVAAILTICALWGFFATSFNVSGQSEIMKASPPDASAIAMSLYSGIFNVGIAMGSIIGGLVTDAGDVGNIGYVGATFVFVAMLIAALYVVRKMRESDAARAEAIDAIVKRRSLWLRFDVGGLELEYHWAEAVVA